MGYIQARQFDRRAWRVGTNPAQQRMANAIGLFWRAAAILILTALALLLFFPSTAAATAAADDADTAVATMRMQSIDLRLVNINGTVNTMAINVATLTERLRNYDTAQGQSISMHNDHEKRIRDLEGFRSTLVGAVLTAGAGGGGIGALISELLRRRAAGRRDDE
ncbi:hypothetical protein N9164_12540 [Draconibacterium sp.]|nr:hypothetical protein [Draconibacterium sp.]